MAAVQPSQENIETVLSISEGALTTLQAANLLKKFSNNLETAVGAYFDNPSLALAVDQPDLSWQSMDNTPPTFRINAGDDRENSSIRAAASRPNSRASHRPEMIDLTPEHAAAGSGDYDADLQRTLALSAQEAQQAGIASVQGQQFGPANRSHYDTQQWAMTTTNTNAREIYEHPPPSKRRRISDQPVFLRGSTETGYLPAILTIYCTIPLAREALRFPPLKIYAYGYDPLWWTGTSDENNKPVSVDNDIMLDPASVSLLCEVQQLMAFLENTNRAYGSADALANLHYYQQRLYETGLQRFLDQWKHAAMQVSPSEPLTQVFTTVALKQSDEGEEPASKSLECLECLVSPTEDGKSLYEVLDETIYSKSLMDPVWIDHIADVVTISLRNSDRPGKALNVEPPAIWYPDRYLEECRGQSFDMRQRMEGCMQEWTTLDKLQRKCQQVTMPDGQRAIVQDAVTTAMRTIEKMVSTAMPNGVSHDMPVISNSDVTELGSDLRRMLERIDQKVALLEERKNEMLTLKREIGQELTVPADNPFEPPSHRYTLQGVGTKPGIFYVRSPVHEDLVDLDDDEGNAEAVEDEHGNRWQWWKISWNRDDLRVQQDATKPQPLPGPVVGPVSQEEAMSSQFTSINGHITKAEWAPEGDAVVADSVAQDIVGIGYSTQKVKEKEVLRAACEETESVCLVYASDQAMNFPAPEISPALQHWIGCDNTAFECELSAEVDRREIEHDQDARQADGMAEWGRAMGQSGSEDVQEGAFEEVKLGMDGTQLNGDPPPYDEIPGAYQHVEMLEKPREPVFGGSRVGRHAEDMLDKIESQDIEENDGPMHIEHAHEPLR
jgi:hypothetical protein